MTAQKLTRAEKKLVDGRLRRLDALIAKKERLVECGQQGLTDLRWQRCKLLEEIKEVPGVSW